MSRFGTFPATAKLRHPVVQIEPQYRFRGVRKRCVETASKKILPSTEHKIKAPRHMLAWGVLLGVVSEITDGEKEPKGQSGWRGRCKVRGEPCNIRASRTVWFPKREPTVWEGRFEQKEAKGEEEGPGMVSFLFFARSTLIGPIRPISPLCPMLHGNPCDFHGTAGPRSAPGFPSSRARSRQIARSAGRGFA